MGLFNKYRNKLAVLLSLALVLPAVNAYAGDRASVSEAQAAVSEVRDAAASEEASIASELRKEASELSSLTPGEDYVDGEGIFLAGTLSEAEQVAKEYDADLTGFDYGVATLRFKESTAEALNNAASLASVSTLVEPNYTAELFDTGEDSSDPLAAEQYYHTLIKDGAAHKTTSGNGVKIAVLDSGINMEHEDLNTTDKNSPGYIEKLWIPELASYNGAEVDTKYSGCDYNLGHGTHVIGIIAATKDNGKGGFGVAPGVSIDSIQITKERQFSVKNIAVGIRMAIDRNADIISMSIGSAGNSASLATLIDEAYDKGIICIAAAGNDGTDTEHYPAAYEHCISVGASTKNGMLAEFSNYGDWVDIVAPGESIRSSYIYTSRRSASLKGDSRKNYYGLSSGTSQATPMVSAVAALCLSSNPDFMKERTGGRFDIIRTILEITSDGKEYSYDDRELYGMVQADAAVNLSKSYNLHPSFSLVDPAGHYGSMLSGYISEKKSFKLMIGDSDGKISNKSLTKSAVWTSSDPDKVSIKKGKLKCTSGDDGDRVIITATVGSDKLFYYLKIHETVKKMGLLRGDMKILGKTDKSVKSGQAVKIANPYAALSDNSVGVYYEKSRKKLTEDLSENSNLADGRFVYDTMIPKGDLKKVRVDKYDTNGDPLVITPERSGSTVTVKYKLLDGSNKRFTIKLRVS
ncbi:MAG: S8 family serine peptidase [Lachnospiraceae bacterium]|nr:S8 family serine peptidase [Lachnospiraceae bacterium]